MSYSIHIIKEEDGTMRTQVWGDVPPGRHEINGHYDPHYVEGNLAVAHRLPDGKVRAQVGSTHNHDVKPHPTLAESEQRAFETQERSPGVIEEM